MLNAFAKTINILLLNIQQSIGSDDGCRNNNVPVNSTSAASGDCNNKQSILFKKLQKQQSAMMWIVVTAVAWQWHQCGEQ